MPGVLSLCANHVIDVDSLANNELLFDITTATFSTFRTSVKHFRSCSTWFIWSTITDIAVTMETGGSFVPLHARPGQYYTCDKGKHASLIKKICFRHKTKLDAQLSFKSVFWANHRCNFTVWKRFLAIRNLISPWGRYLKKLESFFVYMPYNLLSVRIIYAFVAVPNGLRLRQLAIGRDFIFKWNSCVSIYSNVFFFVFFLPPVYTAGRTRPTYI